MKEALLRDFEIRNFRCFEHLLLPKLGRVNLIVGKNNVGKSSVLEALRIYSSNGSPDVLWEIVTSRDEHRPAGKGAPAILSLFRERTKFADAIRVGPREEGLAISIQLRRGIRSSGGTIQYPLMEDSESEDLVGVHADLVVKSKAFRNRVPLEDRFDLFARPSGDPKLRSIFVAANGVTQERQAELWDEVVLSALEEDVIESLRLIVPELERVSLIGSREDSSRSPFAKLMGSDRPFPLKRLGDGVNRIFGMALALVNSKDGVLLIDEIENGVHYSVQESLWRFILAVARRLKVQVFATSHSWDCLKAFQRATAECEDDEGVLTRLEFSPNGIRASQFDEPELEIATREHIEIR